MIHGQKRIKHVRKEIKKRGRGKRASQQQRNSMMMGELLQRGGEEKRGEKKKKKDGRESRVKEEPLPAD